MSALMIKSDEDWVYFKHGKSVYRVTYYEFGTQEDWDKVVNE